MFHNGVNYDPRNVAIIRSDNIYSMVLINKSTNFVFFYIQGQIMSVKEKRAKTRFFIWQSGAMVACKFP